MRKPHSAPLVFSGEWDAEGVFVYQAFCPAIADWAVEHQAFGGPLFNPTRMTWIKPSFAWVLYRSGYGRKHNQERILKIKISHDSMAELLERCVCKHGGGSSNGRVQWDPARDLMSSEGKKRREPRRMLVDRAIQIGLKGPLSERYVSSVLSIKDVTALGHMVEAVHYAGRPNCNSEDAIAQLLPQLPVERPYIPHCSVSTLDALGMLVSEASMVMAS